MPTADRRTRTAAAMENELSEFVEAVGLWFEDNGFSRIAGRIVGWLLVCDPPEQTMQELAENLNASTGSISTTARVLTQFNMVERTSKPGERRTRYRIRPDAWSSTIGDELTHVRSFLDLADRALALLAGTPPGRRHHMETMSEAFHYYERRLAALVQK